MVNDMEVLKYEWVKLGKNADRFLWA